MGGSVFFLGYIPLIPGTIGSALTAAIMWYVNMHHPAFFAPSDARLYWISAMVLTAAAIYLSGDAQSVFGHRDPPQVIIDECAGQFITFFLVPLSLRTLVLGFALFRFFDVVKPSPVHRLEELEGGVGITMDDVAAGVISNLFLHAILWFYHVIASWL
jgi:phosphatidylglycerophosphatase A